MQQELLTTFGGIAAPRFALDIAAGERQSPPLAQEHTLVKRVQVAEPARFFACPRLEITACF
jgi:hypothetical protein